MKFLHLISLVAVATTCNALSVPSDGHVHRRSACTSRSVVSTSSVAVGDKTVEVATLSCDDPVTTRDEPANALRDLSDVCDNICTNVCNFDGGVLPPITSDCAIIIDAITILNGSVTDDFSVDPGEMKQLTYGTCRYYFENLSPWTLTYCWTALSQVGSAAGSACFPPTQPNYSEGLCSPADGSWAVG
ncbi:immunomodulatory protein [Amylocystis lapponica]|nr:immunomodulatory protein [Amylocystis lapponica]